ncbi:MAG: AmmeMemoRadiSam system radical SAM enzyme [Candidatus Eisenbacteria bacterium]|uniref:AmmeMemoRadiSam system radical SAM enzyme n=1 Tax=Eiseniibacteriota bacterium TaxID=2212470 RepID=A0A937XA81_UNCEI|nr:AmmeMemoRadiSam system radical SAM enzyme [Candidatus Eisenbacteria bacterium]
MHRRRLLGMLAGCACGTSLAPRLLGGALRAQDAIDFAMPGGEPAVGLAPARFGEPLPGGEILCRLCPRECRIADMARGYCGVRENRRGEFFTLVHGRVCSLHADPIEKKPFFHFLPGTDALSLATPGCNLACRFCQNWQISQFRPEQVPTRAASPEALLRAARDQGAPTLAYTYSEPTIFYEYMRDIAAYTAPRGIRNVVVSNGYIQERPLRELAPHLSAYKVDLKAFTEEFYARQCNAELAPVLATLETLKSIGLWMEIVVLVIPTLNDDEASNQAMFRWIRATLGPEVPLHLTRFHPTYKILNLPRTPVPTLERLHALARAEGLHYVYIGNAPGHPTESTYCPGCGARVIERYGYVIGAIALDAGRCRGCGHPIPGVWS